MIRSSRRGAAQRRILLAVAATLIPLIAGCEAGTNAPSLQWHQPTDGTGATVGGITISNAFVLGAPLGADLPTGQNAGLFLALTNTGKPDQLLRVSAPGLASSVTLPHLLILRQNHSVLLTGPQPAVILNGLTRPVRGGTVVKIVLLFRRAGLVPLEVPVMPRGQQFASLLPAPAPVTPTPTPTGAHGHGTSSPAASPSPSH